MAVYTLRRKRRAHRRTRRAHRNPTESKSFSLFGSAKRKRSRKGSYRRRARARRRGIKFGWHRPLLRYAGSWRRPRRSKLFPRATRINPRRSRRHYRRNPKLPFAIDKVALGGLKIAGGIAVGLALTPIMAKFAPKKADAAGNVVVPLRRFFGLGQIILGAVGAAMLKNKHAKDISLIVAGVGAYDLIAANLPMLGLPVLPGVAIPGFTSGDEPGVIGASYQVGADYAPALGASYQEVGADDISYGGDSIELD